ncbi:N-methyl-L-tryptophan oxidase [Weizmannia acidilactici]|uniref:N-methyl-L-tryptophan oxidase n=1 Tax=Weizmannia acidilactici TaxID=2607726 RepID=A0A5J4JLR2_9BACI|nr:N-methyl-L-tryptophan oxidase [Weizmannia acidilactici]GER67514.1 N-methyl-L-tryptophan oxidase [Weizmannia acidilactici]GER71645.1 N-methyl-L-tryptophan oxidase [Weizmannia acidilactici]GER73459.1 N-methyl-L-tryptophan oxidase [Weizmannia acidilactici]
MEKHYDVIIVGAGSMGMAAGYFLAKQGVKTLMIDAFDPPHTSGSHHGDTRIIRHAYGEGRDYVPLVLRAQTLWNELEQRSEEKIFDKTGVLSFSPEGLSAFLDEAVASAKTYGLLIEMMDGAEVKKRWPGVAVPDHYRAVFEPDSGVLFPENCICAYRKLAEANGATLLTNTRVEDLKADDRSAIVKTPRGTFTAQKVIISGGAWNGKLLSKLGLDLPLQPTRQTVGWFEADEALFNAGVFPAFTAESPEGMYYGFPSFDGSGVKIGRHDYGQAADPDTINREFGIYPEDEGDIRGFLETYMPKAAGSLKQGKVCMYTKTPDEHFVIDTHPELPHVIVAAGFSGHGFKFASAIGEILSQLAVSGKTDYPLTLFSINRPALRQK